MGGKSQNLKILFYKFWDGVINVLSVFIRFIRASLRCSIKSDQIIKPKEKLIKVLKLRKIIQNFIKLILCGLGNGRGGGEGRGGQSQNLKILVLLFGNGFISSYQF